MEQHIAGLQPTMPMTVEAPDLDPEPLERPRGSASAVDVLQTLALTGGNRTETARRLGISRTTLYRKLQSQ
jgi:transcriptional regulator of acetoin/glycerol metabolism